MCKRYYPVGIQTFREIITEGYVYVDKTDLMWKMQNKRKYIFLSRPRRFGKSLLSSTLHEFFAGNKDLFKGLKVMELEKEWNHYAVIHLDLSETKGASSKEELRNKLCLLLKPYSEQYGADIDEKTPGSMISGIIRRAFQQTGKQIVVIIDEYDAPLLDTLHDESTLDSLRKVMQEFYVPLKSNEQYLKFCFITGITKFSQLSIFSTINNLTNISLWPDFSAVCGITEQELTTVLEEDVTMMAQSNNLTVEEMHQKLKSHYDGYHFARISEDIYNPYSLLKAFDSKQISDYWFDSGTPSFIIHQLQKFGTDIMSLDHLEVQSAAFDKPTEAMTTALPLLYQSGYLTIKDYNEEFQEYQLSLPNQEVRVGYYEGLLPTYVGLEANYVQTDFAAKFWKALKKRNIELAMQEMQAYMASLPYVEGFKKKLSEAATAEGFYEYTLYLIFSMLNVYVSTQVKCLKGRTDMVVWMADTIYVFEFKMTGSAKDALNQINQKSYALPYKTDGRTVYKVGVKFNGASRTPEEWIYEIESPKHL